MAGSWSESPVSTHLRALADELVGRGHTAVFIADKCKREVENRTTNPAVYTWPSFRPTRLRDAWFLRGLIKKYRPDCVVSAFGATNWIVVVGWLMGVPCRVVWYLTLSDQIDRDRETLGVKGWKQKLLHWRKRFVYSLATHIVPNSMAASEDVQQAYGVSGEKCRVFYLSLPDPKEQLEKLEPSKEETRAICVARFHPSKGQDVLLRAIALLKDRFPKAVFEFVGDGPCKQECEELAAELGIADRCEFVGRLRLNEVFRHVGKSYVSVLPSRNECFGLVNIESLAMGTPVVASNVGGVGEIFHDGEQGYLAPAGDPAALADRLAAILGNPELRDRMSRKALERFESFERKHVIGEQVDWFESLPGRAVGSLTMEPVGNRP